MGRAFWDMNVERLGISPAERLSRRAGYAAQMAQNAWGLAVVTDDRRRGWWTPSLFSFPALLPTVSPTTASRKLRG